MSFGWVVLEKITNASKQSVHFVNPYKGTEGDIEAGGGVDDDKCYGNIPYYNNSNKYRIQYYNNVLGKRVEVVIKDLGGDWLISFAQDGKEYIKDITPATAGIRGYFQVKVMDHGLEFHRGDGRSGRLGGLFFWNSSSGAPTNGASNGYGWIYVFSIYNNSKKTVSFYNPKTGASGEIAPGQTEKDKCKGWIPYYDNPTKYWIQYYNETLSKKVGIYIKDLGGEWLASFAQDNTIEHVNSVDPPGIIPDSSSIQITINDKGFEILQVEQDLDGRYELHKRGGLLYWA